MTHTARWRWSVLPVALAPLLLSGCFESDVQEVNQWMAQVEREARVVVPVLTEPKAFTPFAYDDKDLTDPFSSNKMKSDLARIGTDGGGIKPDMERRKELLESFPLDVFKMVGSMQKGGTMSALLQVEKNVYRVEAGQHIGQNFGVITSVSESAVNIKEIVQDAGGDWVSRMAKIELQESMEYKK
ncbi:MAG: type IV pilus assembly protein PilP [Janthinobacterium sp.]|jgi:type IV pilus assembly protein PilP